MNRQTNAAQIIAGLTPAVLLAYGYDASGRMTSSAAKIGDDDDCATSYSYDAVGRLASLIQTDQNDNAVADKRVDFTHNPDSQVASILRYSGTTTASPVASTEFTYDAPGRIDLIHHLGLATGSTFDEEHDYGYDDADRLTSDANLIDGILAEYDYDAAGQLTEADYDALLADEAYDYDDNGNRVLVDNFGGTAQDYDAGPYNRLESDGTYEYAYDDEGNVVSREGVGSEYGHRFYYTWDHRNRLVRVSEHIDDHEVLVVDYVYDALNQLVARLVDKPFEDGHSGTVFVHDGGQVVLQFDHAFGLTPGDLEAEDLSHRYLWGPGVDQLIADEQVMSLSSDGEVLWAMADHLGSVRDVIDSNADLRIHRQFDTFGIIVAETHYNTSGAVVTSGQTGYVDEAFAFTGRWRDKATGLQNNLHRWYDALVGAWLSEDPIGYFADRSNAYRYVDNAPTTYADPLGPAKYITIYCKQPVPGQRDAYKGNPYWGNEWSVGHCFIGLQDTITGENRIYGLYPTKWPTDPSCPVPGYIETDYNEPYDVAVTVEIGQKQYDNAIGFINRSRPGYWTTGPDYNAIKYNCANWALDCMQAAGAQMPRTRGNIVGPWYGTNCGDLGEDLKKERGAKGPGVSPGDTNPRFRDKKGNIVQ